MRFETNFIIGFPEETYSEVLDTLALAQEVASTSFMSNVDFSYMSPEPLTDVAQGVNKEDYIIVKESQYYLDLLAAELTQTACHLFISIICTQSGMKITTFLTCSRVPIRILI